MAKLSDDTLNSSLTQMKENIQELSFAIGKERLVQAIKKLEEFL